MVEKTTPAEPAPIVPAADPDHAETKKVRTTKRSDAAQAFVRNFLSAHPVSVDAFGEAEAVALIEAIDAA
jgi:hypothetical protein